MRGKVFGFQNNAVNIAAPLTERFGLQPVLLGMSAVVTVAGILAWNSTRHVLDDML